MHMDALKKIRANRSKSALNETTLPSVFPGKSASTEARKKHQAKITSENQKMLKAIVEQKPTLDRSDFMELEQEHKRQVSRLMSSNYEYGFPNQIMMKKNSVQKKSGKVKLEPMDDA